MFVYVYMPLFNTGALSCLVEDVHVAALVGAKGGIPPLVRMLDSQDTWLAELAADTLCMLCKQSTNNQRRVLDAGTRAHMCGWDCVSIGDDDDGWVPNALPASYMLPWFTYIHTQYHEHTVNTVLPKRIHTPTHTGGLPALVRLLSDQSVSNFALAAALAIIAMLAPTRVVKESLLLSESFMTMLHRYTQHPEAEIASVANIVSHVLRQDPQPGPLLRLDSIL